MDLDIRQYKNRYGQNGLEGDVSKSKRSTSRPGGKALNQSSSRHPGGTQRGQSRPSPVEDRRYHAMTKITLEPQTRGQALTHPANHPSPYIALHWAICRIVSNRNGNKAMR